MATLRGANTTAQWYYDNYPGGYFPRLDKFLIHTTETRSFPGYSGGASAPNATYDPRKREIRQHHPNNRSARALRDPSSTAVRENRDNIFQLEIVCYSDYNLARNWGGLWVGDLTNTNMEDIARMILQLHDEEGLPLGSSVRWKEGQTSYVSGVRLSGSQFDSYRGILGHVHASGNSHWDPGGFRYSKLESAIQRISGAQPPVEEEEEDPMGWIDGPNEFRELVREANIQTIRDSEEFQDLIDARVQNVIGQAAADGAERKGTFGRHYGSNMVKMLDRGGIDGVIISKELPKSAVEGEGLGLAVARLRRASRLNVDTLGTIVQLLTATGVQLDSSMREKIDQLVQDHEDILAELDQAEEPPELYPQDEGEEDNQS